MYGSRIANTDIYWSSTKEANTFGSLVRAVEKIYIFRLIFIGSKGQENKQYSCTKKKKVEKKKVYVVCVISFILFN